MQDLIITEILGWWHLLSEDDGSVVLAIVFLFATFGLTGTL